MIEPINRIKDYIPHMPPSPLAARYDGSLWTKHQLIMIIFGIIRLRLQFQHIYGRMLIFLDHSFYYGWPNSVPRALKDIFGTLQQDIDRKASDHNDQDNGDKDHLAPHRCRHPLSLLIGPTSAVI